MGRSARAVVMVGKEFVMREYPLPDLAPGTMLLRVELAGICGTDRPQLAVPAPAGRHPARPRERRRVEALGEGVDDRLPRPAAGRRRPGRAGAGLPRRRLRLPRGRGEPNLRGGFADVMYLQPGTLVLKTALPAAVAVLSEPFAVGVHGVMRSGLKFGDTVVVQGAGAIGLLTLVAARASGAGRIILVGGPAGRLELARRLGADVTIDIVAMRDPAERTRLVLAETPRGEGADVVFECAGFLPAITEGLGFIRRSGTFVEMGHFVDVGSLELNPNQLLMRKNLRLEAIWGYGGPDYFMRANRILERNAFPFADLVDPILPLDRLAEGFAALDGGYKLAGRDVIKVAVRGS